MSNRLRALHGLVPVSLGALMIALAVGAPAGANIPGPQLDSNTTHVVAHASATGSVTGTVTDAATSAGILGICIDVFQNGGGVGFGSSETLNDGTYSIANLPPGTYSILVSASCSHTKVSPYANVVDLSRLLTVSAGATTSSVDFALVQSGSISGSVTDAVTNSGLSGICVFASPLTTGSGYASATSVNGSFTILNLSPGTYVVVVDPTCFGTVQSAYAGAIALGTGQRVIAGATTAGPSFALVQGGSVSGTVADANTGAPVAGVCMVFAQAQGGDSYATTATSSDGTYSATNLAPGTYEVELDPGCGAPSTYPRELIPPFLSITAGVNQPNNGYLLTPTDLKVIPVKGRVGFSLTLVARGGAGTGTTTFSVSDGTATGCAVTGDSLHATTPGTCIVTATKGPDVNNGPVSSPPATITMLAKPTSARPAPVSLAFAGTRSALSGAAERSLLSLSYKLLPGASVTVTGYAKGNASLARRRANETANLLKADTQGVLHVTVHVVTSATKNAVTVTTTKN